jgi:hypothetical protein
MKNEYISSKRDLLGSNNLLQQAKQKKTENLSKDAPRKTGASGASPSLSFCPFFISSHHSPIPTHENYLHTKLNTILLAMLA